MIALKKKSPKKTSAATAFRRKEQAALFSMQLPGILFVIIFCYLPMIGIIIAFKDYKFNAGIFGSAWNGVKNFKFLFESNTFFNLVRNTVGYNVVFIILTKVIGVFCAVLLYNINCKFAIKIIQSGIFVPYLLSWIVVSYVSYAYLSYETGTVNSILAALGLERITFYTEPKFWPFILVFFQLWKSIGFDTLVYYGTILAIDTNLFEAAGLDGCTYVKRIWYIVLPHLKSTIIMLLILAIGGICRSDFGLFFYIPQDTGALYAVTDTLDTYIMRAIRTSGNLGSASAAGLIQSVVGLFLVLLSNYIVRKVDADSAIF